MSLTQSYEEKRDLLTNQLYKRSNTSVASRVYTAAQAFFCKISVIGAKFVCGLG